MISQTFLKMIVFMPLQYQWKEKYVSWNVHLLLQGANIAC